MALQINSHRELTSCLHHLAMPQHKVTLQHNENYRQMANTKLNELAVPDRPNEVRPNDLVNKVFKNIDTLVTNFKTSIIDPPLFVKILNLRLITSNLLKNENILRTLQTLFEQKGENPIEAACISIWQISYYPEEIKKLNVESKLEERVSFIIHYFSGYLIEFEDKILNKFLEVFRKSFIIYFQSRFFGPITRMEFIAKISQLEFKNTVSEFAIEAVEEACDRTFKSVYPEMLIDTIYNGRELLSRETMRKVQHRSKKLLVCITNIYMTYYMNTTFQDYQYSQNLDLLDLMKAKPEIWCKFLEFYLLISQLYLDKYFTTPTWRNLTRISKIFTQLFMNASEKVKNKEFTTEFLEVCTRNDLSYIMIWELLGRSADYTVIQKCNEECLKIKNYLLQLKNFTIKIYFEDKKTVNLLNDILKNYSKLGYWECQAIVRNLENLGLPDKQLQIESGFTNFQFPVSAVSKILLCCYPWLIVIHQSDLFQHFKGSFLLLDSTSKRSSNNAMHLDDFLVYLMKEYYHLFYKINNHSILFSELAEISNILNESELGILYEAYFRLFPLKLPEHVQKQIFIYPNTMIERSKNPILTITEQSNVEEGEEAVIYEIKLDEEFEEKKKALPKEELKAVEREKKQWVVGKMNEIKNYKHLSNIYVNIQSIERLIECLPFLLAPNCEALHQLERAIKWLREKFNEEQFQFYNLFLLDLKEKGFADEIKNIPLPLPDLNPDYFEKFLESYEIVDWIQSIKTDNDFTSSIELAIGKSEMECPTELWIPPQNHKPGRVDESKLSMVSAIRRYFYKIIYSKQNNVSNQGKTEEKEEEVPLNKSQKILIELEKEEEVKKHQNTKMHTVPWNDDKKVRKLFEYEWNELVEIFNEIPDGKGGELIEYFETVNEFKYPLMELISSSFTSVSLLKNLFLKQSQSKWICDFNLPEGINLQWIVPRGDTSVIKQQSLTEITDFHSSVILSKSVDTEEYQDIIDLFTTQFTWVKQLNENLFTLYSLGHFDYQNYHVEFPLLLQSHEEIRNEALSVSTIIPSWIDSVKSIRQKYYFLNYFTLKQIWKLIDCLERLYKAQSGSSSTSEQEEGVDIHEKYIKHFLTCFNLPCASDFQKCTDFMENLQCKWSEYRNTTSTGSESTDTGEKQSKSVAEEKLEMIGRVLNELLREYAPSIHAIDTKVIKKDHYAKYFKKGVNLICTESKELVFDYILSIYFSLFILPSREFIYICSNKTTEEDILNFFYRWCYASKNNQRESIYYSIAFPDLLSSELQRIFIANLKDLSIHAENNIIILTSSIENYVTSQLYQSRISISSAFSDAQLYQYSKLYEKLNTQGIRVFTGYHAGCGKTFQIRKWSTMLSAEYIHFPITSIYDSFTSTTLQSPSSSSVADPSAQASESSTFSIHQKSKKTSIISRLMQLNGKYHEEEYLLIHLDLSETLYREFDEYLFELIYLGGLFDSKQQVEYIWNPQTTAFAIESPVDIHKKLRTVHLLPNETVQVNASRFSVSEEELRNGMGPDFITYRNDGTAQRKNFKNAVSAYQQLIYVCYTLDILVLNHGKFPFLPPSTLGDESDTKSYINQLRQSIQLYQSTIRESAMFNDEQNRQKLTSERALELLFTATQLYHGKSSLWCIWNFIRLFYWLLREMHHPNSILNKIAMPSHLHVQLGYTPPTPPPSSSVLPIQEEEDVSKEDGEPSGQDDEVGIDYLKEERKKSSFKGEIIQLLIQTAQEISLRKDKSSNRISHVIMSEFPSYSMNGRWNRTLFDCYGQPCFHKKNYYLYFFKPADCWIVNNSIEDNIKVPFAKSATSRLSGEWYFSAYKKVGVKGITAQKVGNSKSATCGYLIEGLPEYFFASMNGFYQQIRTEKGLTAYKLQHSDDFAFYFYFDNFDEAWLIVPALHTSKTTIYARTYDLVEWDIFRSKSIFAIEHRDHIGIDDLSEESTDILGLSEKDHPSSSMQHASNVNQQSNISQDEVKEMVNMWRNTIKWNESNHDCILFSNKTSTVKVLSLHPEQLKDRLGIGLIERFEQNGIMIGESLDSLNEGFHEIISSLTEIERTKEEAEKLLDGSYCLTKDSVLKMLTIYARIRCGVPVVLLGECGCGKTMLIRYLCAWMGIKLFILDVNGGTTEDDIINIFLTASTYLEDQQNQTNDQQQSQSIHESSSSSSSSYENKHQAFVFLDEINTCPHMGLLCEAICHRSVKGRRIHEGICILAALNPYRKRNSNNNKNKSTPGLVYQLHSKSEVFADPMSELVYRVHPIPSTLRDFIFDFGSLSDKDEKKYIKSMINSTFQSLIHKKKILSAEAMEKLILEGQSIVEITELTPQQKESNKLMKHNFSLLSKLISKSQIYIREIESDPSVTSLRDVKRCLSLILWFMDKLQSGKRREEDVSYSTFPTGTILSLAFVYYYRMADSQDRKKYWEMMNNEIILYKLPSHFVEVKYQGACLSLLEKIKERFCSNIKVEKGVAMNQALEENIFVLLICVLNKIPVFLVGKPGSSKTLTLQVIASNLQGKQSEQKFWRKFPSIHIFQYQCSPMSDSYSIQHQFDIAVRYQKHASDCITILLLDEVGLAEHSPDMPLKVLHTMLIEPTIAIVGVSNWVLDAAKMNRAICIQRTEPTKDDIQTTGESILNFIPIENKEDQVAQLTYKRLVPKLGCLAKAYHEIYVNQGGSREFIGMRDYYHLIKCLCGELLRTKERLEAHSLFYVVGRNFGGQPEAVKNYYKIFFTRTFTQSFPKNKFPPVRKLIAGNLNDTSSRHLMLLTQNSIALPLLFGCGFLDERDITILVGSEFKEDKNELYLVTQINQVKQCMASGSTVILLNHDNIYEALYDVLNQRFLYKTDSKTGKVEKLLRLAIGSKSQLCQVKDGFKIIVIVEQEHAYNNLDLPLLNRFEKQVLTAIDILSTDQFQICKSILTDWVMKILKQSRLSTKQQLFCAFQRDTLPSLVISIMEQYKYYNKDQLDAAMPQITDKIKYALGKIALPVAVRLSSELAKYVPDYFNNHSDLYSIINHYIIKSTPPTSTTSTTTSTSTSTPSGTIDEIDNNSNMVNEYTTSNILITFSSITQIVIEGLIKDNNNPYEVIQLAELPSERSLVYRIEEYYNNDNNKNQLLIIQCDPISTKQTVIDHAKLISTKYQKVYIAENKDKININKQKHILFIIHLPPGTKLRDRKFALHFQLGWECYFVDDLRILRSSVHTITTTTTNTNTNTNTSTSNNKLNILPYLDHPISDLIEQGVIDLCKIIKSKYQQSLSICLLPSVDGREKENVNFHKERIKFFHERMNEHLSSFDLCKEFILKNVYKLLKYHCTTLDKKQLLFQIKMIISENSIGTQYHSLELAMNVLITQELANLIAASDINFNLQTYSARSRKLWMKLSELNSIFDVNLVGTMCKIGDKQLLLQTQTIKNTGMQQSIIATFPWSFKLITLFHNQNVKNKIYQLSQKQQKEEERDEEMIEQLYQISKTILGEEILTLANEFEGGIFRKYLNDFLQSVLSPYPGVSFYFQEKIYRIFLSHHHKRTLQSFAGIHVGYWQIEQNALRICFFFATTSLPMDIFKLLTHKITSFDIPVDQIDFQSATVNERISTIEYEILLELLMHIKSNFIAHGYSEYFTSIRSNIELIFLSIFPYISPSQRMRIKLEYLSLLILNLYTREIMYPHITHIIQYLNQNHPSSIDINENSIYKLLQHLGLSITQINHSINARKEKQAIQNHHEIILDKFNGFLKLLDSKLKSDMDKSKEGLEGLALFGEMVEKISIFYEYNGTYNVNEQRRYIHRYIHEILFGEQELFFRANLHLQLSNPLLSELEKIINFPLSMIGMFKQYPQRYIELNKQHKYLSINISPDVVDISLRKIIIHCLIHYYSQQGGTENMKEEGGERRIQLYSMESYQLYVSYLEDHLELDTPNKEDIYVVNETIENQLATLSEGEYKNSSEYEKQSKIYSYLTSLSKIKKYLILYTRTIIRLIMIKSGELINQLNNIIDEEKIKWILNKNNHLITILYTLKLFIHYGGLESIKDIIYLNEPALNDWLPVNRELASKMTVSIADPFPVISAGENKILYNEVNKILISLLNTSLKLASKDRDKLKGAPVQILLSNLFQQFVCSTSYTQQQLQPVCHLTKELLQAAFRTKRGGSFHWISILNLMENDTSAWLDKTNPIDLSILQIGCHMLLNMLDRDNEWYKSLFAHPTKMHQYFLPSMPTDLVAIFSKSMSERLRWYVCPNGHPYSVGECGKPMQSYTCIHPGCGAVIGGRSHIPHAGNTDWKASSSKYVGYVISSPGESSHRLSPAMEEFLRLQLHIAMLFSSLSSETNEQVMRHQFGAPIGQNFDTDVPKFYKRLMEFIKHSWNKLREILELGDDNLCYLLHGILKELHDHPVESYSIVNSSSRDTLEIQLDKKISNFFQTPRFAAAQFQELFGSTAVKSLLQTVLHEGIYDNLSESTQLNLNQQSKPTGYQLLWRVKEIANYHHFSNYVSTRAKWVELKLLKFILKYEKQMKIIKYIAVILKWHSILFDIFQDNTITREQALSITNKQAIERLPEESRDSAFKVFYEFAECFNMALPFIENIFECQRNPYLASDGSVDLSGAGTLLGQGVQMSLDVSVMFSLPSMTEGLDDTMGLCTIKLLQLMQNTQTDLLNKELLQSLQGSSKVKSSKKVKEEQPQQQDDSEYFSINYLTNQHVVEHQLINYERDRNLIPLLHIYAKQSLQFGEGNELEYDLIEIQKALYNTVIVGKRPFLIQIRHFHYLGDLKIAGKLSGLHLRVPQINLPESILENISTELDTQERVHQLFTYLEICISFLLSIGSSNVSIRGDITLSDFVINTLLISQDIWNEITTTTITQQARLQNIQCLFMFLEEQMKGNPLEQVSPIYKEPLSSSSMNELRSASKFLQVNVLLSMLRDLMIQQLSQSKWPATDNLKQYLTYLNTSIDIEEATWFHEHFPESLTLAQAYNTFQYLSTMI